MIFHKCSCCLSLALTGLIIYHRLLWLLLRMDYSWIKLHWRGNWHLQLPREKAKSKPFFPWCIRILDGVWIFLRLGWRRRKGTDMNQKPSFPQAVVSEFWMEAGFSNGCDGVSKFWSTNLGVEWKPRIWIRGPSSLRMADQNCGWKLA